MWIKFFADSTLERGRDKDIDAGKASWSRGRLTDIIEVRSFMGQRVGSLKVPNTHWHQFDRFVVVIGDGNVTEPLKTHCVTQAEILPRHQGQSLVCSNSGGYFFWVVVQDLKKAGDDYKFSKLLTDRHVGKWLTLILPKEDYPTLTFSTKGKMYDNQPIPR